MSAAAKPLRVSPDDPATAADAVDAPAPRRSPTRPSSATNPVERQQAMIEAAFTAPEVARFPRIVRVGILFGALALLWAGIIGLAAALFIR